MHSVHSIYVAVDSADSLVRLAVGQMRVKIPPAVLIGFLAVLASQMLPSPNPPSLM